MEKILDIQNLIIEQSESSDFYLRSCFRGSGKTTKQLKTEKESTVIADGILVGSRNVIPLYLFGFLY